jgi:hypothetical protein
MRCGSQAAKGDYSMIGRVIHAGACVLRWLSARLHPAASASSGVNVMQRLFVGLVLVVVALSVNASGLRSSSVMQRVHAEAPVCPPGEKAVPHIVNGQLVWVCVPVE